MQITNILFRILESYLILLKYYNSMPKSRMWIEILKEIFGTTSERIMLECDSSLHLVQ